MGAVVVVAGASASASACGTRAGVDAGSFVIDGQAPVDIALPDVPAQEGGRDAATGVDAPGPDGGTVSLPEGFFPPEASAFGTTDNEPESVQVSVSGEALATGGYDYKTAAGPGAAVFVDGWELRFERFLVVLDHVRLNQPAPDPSMRGAVGGLVAQADGPWVVDLHRAGALTGAGGAPETAVPIAVFTGPTAGGGFDPTVRYAFSYEIVPANARPLRNLNVDEGARAEVAQMLARGWTEYFAGTATYRGRAASAAVDPAFVGYPVSVRFAFGFSAPSAYVNCHNPELGAADTAATRGVQPAQRGAVRAQITLHTDHFFWDETDVEGTPLHFDPLAARALGFGAAPAVYVTMDSLAGVMPAALTDATGRPVPDRGGMTAGVVDNAPPPAYAVHGAGSAVRDLRDFVAYNARAQGHLNSDGLCFVAPTGPLAY
jgi:hypothetical protein